MVGEVRGNHEKVTFGQELKEEAMWIRGGGIFQAVGGKVQRPCGEHGLGKFQEEKKLGEGESWRALLAKKIFGF